MRQTQPHTQYNLSLSYGKDSLACLEAIRLLGFPLDRIVHAEVWATDTIPADLPPMVEFKKKADEIIQERYGIEVEHICSLGTVRTFEQGFYATYNYKKIVNLAFPDKNGIYGFPVRAGNWCNSRLKISALNQSKKSQNNKNTIQYLGIAADETERIKRHTKQGIILPLVEIGWDEAYCRKWCEENDLLSPIYTTATRGGCWFCHNQPVNQLRLLRREYPDLWALLLKWDKDSPVSFHPDGHTVHDFDKRFEAEEKGLVPTDRKFRWNMLPQ